ncbi:hypothetical protein BKA64DRAFT_716106 [Cadophora sp. MPI-SDFR-AT-0126]|nr:hypothetical protein BKA64DRAFT_716106 [Leotiomycetes sp. MPI-SDFR-AT-0126]
MKHIIVPSGPSGRVKSTVRKFLQEKPNFEFFEGDKYHPQYDPNDKVEKLKSGSSLSGLDYAFWLRDLSQAAIDANSKHEVVVISCSALERPHRNFFRSAVIDHNKVHEKSRPDSNIKLHFLFLQISEKKAQPLAEQRQSRNGEFYAKECGSRPVQDFRSSEEWKQR